MQVWYLKQILPNKDPTSEGACPDTPLGRALPRQPSGARLEIIPSCLNPQPSLDPLVQIGDRTAIFETISVN